MKVVIISVSLGMSVCLLLVPLIYESQTILCAMKMDADLVIQMHGLCYCKLIISSPSEWLSPLFANLHLWIELTSALALPCLFTVAHKLILVCLNWWSQCCLVSSWQTDACLLIECSSPKHISWRTILLNIFSLLHWFIDTIVGLLSRQHPPMTLFRCPSASEASSKEGDWCD